MTSPASLTAYLADNKTVYSVRLTRVLGSSPRNAGTEMLVSPGGCFGTIGGGQLEYMMIDEARAMMARQEDWALKDVPLGPEIGQCCGGRVEVMIKRMGARDRKAAVDLAKREAAGRPHVYVLGAGHVGRALAGFLENLPVRCVVVDPRAEELALCCPRVDLRLSAMPEAEITAAPPGSAFVVLTHDHALDFLLTSEALMRGDAAYVGMIGSATKRAKFRNWCRDQCGGLTTQQLVCPIGAGGSADKRPAIIASFVAAELMTVLTTASTSATASAG